MRRLLLAMIGLLYAAPALVPANPYRVVVVCNNSVDAYKEAVEGIRQVLGRNPEMIDTAAGGDELFASARRDPAKVYIAVGRDSYAASLAAKLTAPVIGVMLLREDIPPGAAGAGAIYLDVPLTSLLAEVHRLFPARSRVGVLVTGQLDRAAAMARARELGISVQFVDIRGPADLVREFLSFKGKADLVIALADSELYNSATVKPLVLASLESGLPLIGFSAVFVRAGAAAGIFADFREAGRQAAEAAQRYDPTHPQKVAELPRKVNVAVNQRVLRLLGLDYGKAANVLVFR